MDVFVWVNYGVAKVYNADDTRTLDILYNEIIELTGDYFPGDEEYAKISKLDDSGFNTKFCDYYNTINRILKYVKIGSVEAFEWGTGFNKVIT